MQCMKWEVCELCRMKNLWFGFALHPYILLYTVTCVQTLLDFSCQSDTNANHNCTHKSSSASSGCYMRMHVHPSCCCHQLALKVSQFESSCRAGPMPSSGISDGRYVSTPVNNGIATASCCSGFPFQIMSCERPSITQHSRDLRLRRSSWSR